MRIFYTDLSIAQKLAKKLKNKISVSLTESQKLIALMSGYKDWNELKLITNKGEAHPIPDRYDWPNYFKGLPFDDVTKSLMIFFKNYMMYPNLDIEVPMELQKLIKNHQGSIVVGSQTNLPSHVYKNLSNFVYKENVLIVDTLKIKEPKYSEDFKVAQRSNPFNIFEYTLENNELEYIESLLDSNHHYMIKIHASDMKNLLSRYNYQLGGKRQASLFIYYEIINNKVIYHYFTGPQRFEEALSIAMRKDSDTIFIGEIKNPKTADLAFKAALNNFNKGYQS